MAHSDHAIEVDPRVVFAAERTLLAWTRTGLALMALGFVVARFALILKEIGLPTATSGRSSYVGTAIVITGGAVIAWSTIHHHRTMAHLREGQPLGPRRGPMVIASVAALAALVLAGLILYGP